MKDVNAQALIIENHVSSLTFLGRDGLHRMGNTVGSIGNRHHNNHRHRENSPLRLARCVIALAVWWITGGNEALAGVAFIAVALLSLLRK
jgi:hypothetical protein